MPGQSRCLKSLRPVPDLWLRVMSSSLSLICSTSSHLQRLVTRDKGEFRALKDLIWHVRRRLSEVKTPTITVGCYCDNGAVESVGLTWFSMQLLEALGYVVLQPNFLDRQLYWPLVRCQRLYGPGACRECDPDADSEPRRRLKAILHVV